MYFNFLELLNNTRGLDEREMKFSGLRRGDICM